MEIEYKEVPVAAATVEDEGNGIISALVSVTGLEDNVKDIIVPGAYNRSLGVRRPKGVWHHSWTDPIAKTLDAKELMPGDPELPKALPNGDPWPVDAGALKIRMQFNLDGNRGKQAYSDVKFFGNDQEWSIGYNVPKGGSQTKDGVRYIKDIDLYEFSPVLFGAMPHARTMQGVKAAQLAYKSLTGRGEPTDDELDGIEPPDDDMDEDEFYGDGDDKAISPDVIRTAIKALNVLLHQATGGTEGSLGDTGGQSHKDAGFKAFVELKAMEYLTLTEAFDDLVFPESLMDSLGKAAASFDEALSTKDADGVAAAAGTVMDILEAHEEVDTLDEKDGMAVLARVMGDLMESVSENVETSDAKAYTHFGVEYKMLKKGTRKLGWPVPTNRATLSRKSLQSAFLAGLDDDALAEVKAYLVDTQTNRALVRAADNEVEARIDSARKRVESKAVVVDMTELDSLKEFLN